MAALIDVWTHTSVFEDTDLDDAITSYSAVGQGFSCKIIVFPSVKTLALSYMFEHLTKLKELCLCLSRRLSPCA